MLPVFALALAILTAGLALVRPRLIMGGGGKAFGFVALFVFPLLASSAAGQAHLERSKSTSFCLSCHVMEQYGRSLHIDDLDHVPAKHFQNNRVPRESACYSCHTTYTMYGDLSAKLRGLRHLYVQYLGKIPDRIALYKPYHNRECLHCHAGARGFEETSAHREETTTMDRIRRNQLSCLSAGCHAKAHDVTALDTLKTWAQAAPQARGAR